ncbi:hypothetical protein V8F06_012624 [Rhypophila decipiens]
MYQNIRSRTLPTVAAIGALAGAYWLGGMSSTNRDPLPMHGHISETIETIGRQGGLPGKVNLSERERGDGSYDPRNTKIMSHTSDTNSKRSADKTRD